MEKRHPLRKVAAEGKWGTEEREADDKQWPPVTQDPAPTGLLMTLSVLA